MKRLTAAVLLACAAFAAAAAPAFAIKQFIVFFHGTNPEQLDPVQWQLGPEADAVISEAASVVVQRANADDGVHLIAGDQRVGTLEMSIERSRRRAEAIKQSLIAKGVPADAIFVHACGFRRFLVETPHGTLEPMNRFVTLDLASRDDKQDPCKQ
jgi:OmpA-OmpF porin, OOP family